MYESVSSIYRPYWGTHARSNPRFPYPCLYKLFANFFRFFENYGLTNHLRHPIMQLNKNKPLEGREVESILAIAESRRCWECGIAGLSKWAFRGSRQRAYALLDEDGTQTRYQAAPYDGTG